MIRSSALKTQNLHTPHSTPHPHTQGEISVDEIMDYGEDTYIQAAQSLG